MEVGAGQSGQSLVNIHCASWRDKASVWDITKQKRFMAKCMCASLSPPPLPVPCLSLSVGVLCCAQRLALGGGSAAHLTPRRLRGSRAQDCEQSLEGAGGGCRFMDDNRLCVSCANHCVLMASWSSCLLVSSAAQAAGGRE